MNPPRTRHHFLHRPRRTDVRSASSNEAHGAAVVYRTTFQKGQYGVKDGDFCMTRRLKGTGLV